MDYVMRSVRAEEWPLARQLRLDALQDPAAPVAFLDSYEAAVARPDAFWQDRTAAAAEGGDVRQFVAESPEGEWVGTVTVLIERPEDDVRFGLPAEVNQGHLVGVFVRPEVRGAGVTDALFRVAVDWAWSLSAPRLERVRLYVHENNPRAAAFYRRFGFVPSEQRMPVPGPGPGSGAGERREWELEYVIERG
ncbi:GNAT family N-acetyltransferase [Streptomyces cyaneofuscatus]|uniref:GNAT family N-acetyltransferase n=1 Tax=Streptomyces cyaneofuscatus TaxID=66883 RepID=UPI002D766853|nr:GNAT family N-acetyltransferase [Streptomyces cyaneofuscatus]WRO11585.1 GNAT family N-acetyltransferase [Streptomyces cyaneofuscatus]